MTLIRDIISWMVAIPLAIFAWVIIGIIFIGFKIMDYTRVFDESNPRR